MKKKLLLLTILFIIFPIMRVSATGITTSPSSVSVVKGSNQTVTVTVTNLAALLDISTSNASVASISKTTLDLTSNGPGSVSGTFVITGVSAGNANVTINTADATDFDGNDYSKTITIKVTVTNPVTQPPSTQPPSTQPPTRPTQPPSTQPTVEDNTTRPTERTPDPGQPEQPQTPVEDTTTTTEEITIPIIDNNSNGVDDEIEFSSLKIVGFPIAFDPKVNTYSINIGEANALYINASALTEGATIDKNGEISVEGLDSVVLTLYYNDKSSKITINLKRSEKEEIVASPKTDSTPQSRVTAIIISVLFFTTSCSIAAFIYKEQLMKTFVKAPVSAAATTEVTTEVMDSKLIQDPISFNNTNTQSTEINNDTNIKND